MIVVLATIGIFLVAVMVGRYWVCLLPAVGWPVFFVGLYFDWWGTGVGDFWEQAMVLYALLGVGVTILGVLFRNRLLARVSSSKGG